MTESALMSLATIIGSALVAFITTRLRKPKQKEEYIDVAIAHYEVIMKRQDEQIANKDKEILRLTAEIVQLENERERLRR